MPLDANKIHQYVGSELAAPADQMLNRLAKSTSDAIRHTLDQSVQVFASKAERTSLFPNPHSGAVTWQDDVNRLEVYTGSGWVPVAHPSDARVINGSTDTTGLMTFTHFLGLTPTWCVATMALGPFAPLNLLMTPVVASLGATTIGIAIRREDTHVWMPSQPVTIFVSYGATVAPGTLPAPAALAPVDDVKDDS